MGSPIMEELSVWRLFIQIVIVCDVTAAICPPKPFHVFCGSKIAITRLHKCKTTKTDFCTNATADDYQQEPCLIDNGLNSQCGRLRWLIEPWGKCQDKSLLDYDYDDLEFPFEGVNFGYGLRKRTIKCILENDMKKLDYWILHKMNCDRFSDPHEIQVCELKTPQDCAVSEYSQWTSCGTSCLDPYRYRTRSILAPTLDGGKSCPSLIQKEKCIINKPCTVNKGYQNGKFHLKIFNWTQCVPIANTKNDTTFTKSELANYFFYSYFLNQNETTVEEGAYFYKAYEPQLGFQYRYLACVTQTKELTYPTLCGKNYTVQLNRACIVENDCYQFSYTGWKMKTLGCIGKDGKKFPSVYKRENIVTKHTTGYGKLCEPVREISNDYTNLLKCSELFYIHVSPWSPCSRFYGKTGQPVECGGGTRTRSVSCLTVNEDKPVDFSYCERLGGVNVQTVETCQVECPVDCVPGEWEPWSECFPPSCPHLDDDYAFRLRKRNISIEAKFGGKDCSHFEESQRCGLSTCYARRSTNWGFCDLGGKTCGNGFKQRSYYCVNQNRDIVEFYRCNSSELFQNVSCRIACPGDCAYSDWSQWSECSHPCYNEVDVPIQTREKRLISQSIAETSCLPALVETEECNLFKCRTYHWGFTNWGPCKQPNHTRHQHLLIRRHNHKIRHASHSHSTIGIRSRNVTCVDNENSSAATAFCVPLKKPHTEEKCTIEGKPKCIMSGWSDFNPCGAHCQSHPNPTSYVSSAWRSRVVLKRDEKATCGHTFEHRPCFSSTSSCVTYKWMTGPWSSCQVSSVSGCGEGFHTRRMWCSNDLDKGIAPLDYCYAIYNFLPQVTKPCVVTCELQCQMSGWSEWSECPKNNCTNAVSVRKRLTGMDRDMNENCFRNVTMEETRKCECDTYEEKIDPEWTSCIIVNQTTEWSNGDLDFNVCGTGFMYKRHYCVDSKKRIVESHLCGVEGPTIIKAACEVKCPLDCILTDWSKWTPCSQNCGLGHQERYRRIVRPSFYNGRPCGHLNDSRPCQNKCHQLQWEIQHWQDCLPDALTPNRCGSGTQRRNIRCVQTSEAFPNRAQPDILCNGLKKPQIKQNCFMFCPDECAYGDWSNWSQCDTNCSATRYRSRSVVRKSTATSTSCDDVLHSGKCEFNENCFTYKWSYTFWGACVPEGISYEDCGKGFRTRLAFCERSDGILADRKHCSEIPILETKAECEDPCPVDCKLSSWSNWDESLCSIGNAHGDRMRRRVILHYPTTSGRPCGKLTETMPCPVKVKYRLEFSAWSPCIIPRGVTCGYGKQKREMFCVRSKTYVALQNCYDLPEGVSLNTTLIESELSLMDQRLKNLETEMNCYVPCPDDIDCKITEWSSWSNCYAQINVPENSVETQIMVTGYQTRSRAIVREALKNGENCPKNLVEVKPCLFTKRLKFNWEFDSHGYPICVRSDGVVISAGCDISNKPCPVKCSIDGHWHCDATACDCEKSTQNRPKQNCQPLIMGYLQPHYAYLTNTRFTTGLINPLVSNALKTKTKANLLISMLTILWLIM